MDLSCDDVDHEVGGVAEGGRVVAEADEIVEGADAGAQINSVASLAKEEDIVEKGEDLIAWLVDDRNHVDAQRSDPAQRSTHLLRR